MNKDPVNLAEQDVQESVARLEHALKTLGQELVEAFRLTLKKSLDMGVDLIQTEADRLAKRPLVTGLVLFAAGFVTANVILRVSNSHPEDIKPLRVA